MNNEDTRQGFYFRDLGNVAHVLTLIYKGIENKKYELITALSAMLGVLQIPFQKKVASDQLV